MVCYSEFFSTCHLLSGSNGHFLGLTCISEEKSNFAAEEDILAVVDCQSAYFSHLKIGCVNSKSSFLIKIKNKKVL